MNSFNWRRVPAALWANKQAITGAVTTVVSSLATANMIAAETANKVTVVTGIVTMLLATVYTIFKSASTAPPTDDGQDSGA